MLFAIGFIIGGTLMFVVNHREIARLRRRTEFQQRLLLLGNRLGTHNLVDEVPTQRGRHHGGE